MKTVFALILSISLIAGGIAMAKGSDYQLWAATTLRKVLPDEKPSKQETAITLSAARGEKESAQIVITAAEEPLKQVRVRLKELVSNNGSRISTNHFEINRVGYINMQTLNRIAPDPLPPTALFDVEPNKSQPVWITVSIPRSANAGEYAGELSVEPQNAPAKRIPLRLKVWNFTLPDGPSSKTAFGISEHWIAPQHGVEVGSLAHRQLVDKYYRFLVDHWISPYSLPVPVTSEHADKYIKDPRVTGFVIPYSDNIDEMRASVKSLRRRGLLDKAYFYPIDEPVNADAYKRLVEVCSKIHQVDPKLRIVIPYYTDPSFDSNGKTIHELADGYMNIWCPNIMYFDQHKDRLYAKLNKGEEFWWYVCCGPGEPYPNYFLSMDAPSHRVLPWLQWKYRCQGLLYWSTTWWNSSGTGPHPGTSDPWVDMATVKDINKDLYGDGSLLNPGKKVGVNGPVSSIRLELLREGLEDYEYLVLLEKKLGREKAEDMIGDLVKSPTEFSRDPVKWIAVRDAIGNELSR